MSYIDFAPRLDVEAYFFAAEGGTLAPQLGKVYALLIIE